MRGRVSSASIKVTPILRLNRVVELNEGTRRWKVFLGFLCVKNARTIDPVGTKWSAWPTAAEIGAGWVQKDPVSTRFKGGGGGRSAIETFSRVILSPGAVLVWYVRLSLKKEHGESFQAQVSAYSWEKESFSVSGPSGEGIGHERYGIVRFAPEEEALSRGLDGVLPVMVASVRFQEAQVYRGRGSFFCHTSL